MTPDALTGEATRSPQTETTPAPPTEPAPLAEDSVRPAPAPVWSYWPFLLLALPYLLAWAVPFVWCWQQWGDPNHPQFIQPWIPLLAFILIWSRRDHLRALLRAMEKNPPKTWLERGSPIFLILGCLLYLFAHLVQVKGVAVGALLLIAIGAVFALYGGRMVKSLRVPILFSLLMFPPPDTMVDALIFQFRVKTVKAASIILNLLHFDTRPEGWFLRFERTGELVEFPIWCSGAGVVVPVAVLLLWWAIFRRRAPMTWIFLPLVGIIVAFAVNLIRVLLAAVFAARNPALSKTFLDLNGWILVALAIPLTLGLEWLFFRLRSQESRKTQSKALRASSAALARTGRTMNLITVPFDYLFKGIGYLATLWRRAERNIEGNLKRLFPKRKGRRRQ